MESDAVRYCGRDRRPTTMLQVGRFTLRRRKLASDAAPLRLRLLQAELFYFAGTIALHRFFISSPDMLITDSIIFLYPNFEWEMGNRVYALFGYDD